MFMSTWTPTVGDKFVCIHEENNTHDTHAMGAYDDKKLVVHLPKEASRYFHFFTLHNGPEISGEVTDINSRREQKNHRETETVD